MSPAVELAHQNAVDQGKDFYTDPETGLMVMTALYLRKREFCCANICRHCPFGHDGKAHSDTI
ncbi:MAG: DUF5522 domain-containing protein [Actinobacteria bacterium]|nr:DUF5522 domain-containing protein [Actinomycetota bacterium]